MVDIVDAATRSRMMAGIRGKHTRPEVGLRRSLHARGLRFRLHVRSLPGVPDIVLPRWRAAILVQGCFWHRHEGCRYATTPATRPEFWEKKFRETVARDRRNADLLVKVGLRVAVVWECALKSQGADNVAEITQSWLNSAEPSLILE